MKALHTCTLQATESSVELGNEARRAACLALFSGRCNKKLEVEMAWERGYCVATMHEVTGGRNQR